MTELLYVAIRKDRNRADVVKVGERDECLAEIEKMGAVDGRSFVVGPVRELLDFFVDATAPEAEELLRQAAIFERTGAVVSGRSLDASSWLRGGRRRDAGVRMCMAALAVKQGTLTVPQGKQVQAEIATVLRATAGLH